MDDNTLLQHFARLKEAVLAKRPILKEILEKNGTKPMYDYAQDYINVNLNPPIEGRQEEFLSTFKKEAARRFNPEMAEKAAEQLVKHYFVSTADHHGPICHPFFVNSNLLTVAPCFEEKTPHIQYIIVLACANITINNSSFPRGIFFHNVPKGKSSLELHRLGFFSANDRSTVFSMKAYNKTATEKVKSQITASAQKGEVSGKEKDDLIKLIEDIYEQPEVLACKTYSEQVSKTNYHLWNRFFEGSGYTAPKLMYLELESLVVELILDHHLNNKSTIHEILFNPEYEPLILNYFEGIFGAFSMQDHSGTYLFWGMPEGSSYRVQMWKKGNRLVSQDGSFEVELTPEAIRAALEKGQLIPGLMLCYIIIAFYYGLKCLGGFNQVNYLTYLKNAYIKMQVDRGDYRSIEVCARSQTKEICDGLTVVFLEDPKGRMVLASGVDLILHRGEKTWPNFSEIMKSISFEEGLNPLMPEIYKIIYPDNEWDPVLAKITDEDIIRITGLKEKMKACAFIKNAPEA